MKTKEEVKPHWLNFTKFCPVCNAYESKLATAFDEAVKEICGLYKREYKCQVCPASKKDKDVCYLHLRAYYLKKKEEEKCGKI